jgi:hypothetical protein
MGGMDGVTNTINVSRNLKNPPHYDIGDLGNGTSVWVGEEVHFNYPGYRIEFKTLKDEEKKTL